MDGGIHLVVVLAVGEPDEFVFVGLQPGRRAEMEDLAGLVPSGQGARPGHLVLIGKDGHRRQAGVAQHLAGEGGLELGRLDVQATERADVVIDALQTDEAIGQSVGRPQQPRSGRAFDWRRWLMEALVR